MKNNENLLLFSELKIKDTKINIRPENITRKTVNKIIFNLPYHIKESRYSNIFSIKYGVPVYEFYFSFVKDFSFFLIKSSYSGIDREIKKDYLKIFSSYNFFKRSFLTYKSLMDIIPINILNTEEIICLTKHSKQKLELFFNNLENKSLIKYNDHDMLLNLYYIYIHISKIISNNIP